MFRYLAPRWLRSALTGFGSKKVSKRRQHARKLTIESLEHRLAPATLTWVGDQDANWNTDNGGNTNWSGDVLPANGDTLVFDGTGTGTNLNNDTTAGNSYALQFTANGYVISGNEINFDLAGSDVSSSTGQVLILAPAVFAAGTTVDVTGGQLQFSGPVSGPAGGLTKTGAGTLTITANATYQQGTDVQAGIFAVAFNGGITSPGTTTLGSGTLTGTAVNQTGFINAPIDGLTGSSILASAGSNLTMGDAASTAGFATAGSITVGNNATLILNDADAADLGPSTSLGGGTATLAAANGVALSAGDTLSGSGTVQGDLQVGAGSVSPGGAAIGALAVTGNLTFGATGTYQAQLNDTGAGQFDTVAVTGTATLNGARLVLSGTLVPAAGQSLAILTATGGITGAFSDASGNPINQGSLVTFNGAQYVVSYAGGSVTLTYSPNPVINAGNLDNEIILRLSAGGNVQVVVDAVVVFDQPAGNVNSLTINGEAGNDRLTIDTTNGNPLPPGGVSFNGGSQFDRLNLGGLTAQTVQLTALSATDGYSGSNQGLLSFSNVNAIDAGAGINTLIGTNNTAFWDIQGPNSGQYQVGNTMLDWTAFANLTGGSGNDMFGHGPTGTATGVIDGGAGLNSLDYSVFNAPVAVNLGLGTTGLTGTIEGDQEVPKQTTGATGTVTITNYNAATKTFDISAAVSGLDPAQVTGYHIHRAPFGVNGPIIIDLAAIYGLGALIPDGAGGFTFTATGVQLPALSEAAFLGGITYFNVHTAAAPGGLIRGQLFSSANVNLATGTATNTGSITNIQNVIGSQLADSLVGNFGNNNMSGLGGNDTFVGGPGADTMAGGNENDILVWSNGDGSDVMDGQAGTDLVNVNGSVTVGDVFTVGAGVGGRVAFARVSPGPFTLDIGTTEGLTVNAIGGDDSVSIGDLTGVANLTTINFNGLAGNDSITGPNQDTNWTINGRNRGFYVAGGTTTNFTGAENLFGGTGADNFAFVDMAGMVASLDGTINGGGGANTLNYAGAGAAVAVNLGLGSNGLSATLEGDQEVPKQVTTAAGTVAITNYNAATKTFDISVTVTDLDPALVTGFHIHRSAFGTNGPIIVDFLGQAPLVPVGTGFTFNLTGVNLGALNEAAFLGGITYVNIHTAAAPGGLIRGQLFTGGNVNLATGTATNTGGISNIQNVIGSDLADSLVGNFGNNNMSGLGGNDIFVGGPGADTMSGGNDNDIMVWSNGDGSDVMDGQAGTDLVNVNGAVAAADIFTVGAGLGGRVAFARTNLGPFTLDIGTTEGLTVNGVGGDDQYSVGDLAGTTLTALSLNGLAGNDTVTGPNLDTDWTINGRNRGSFAVLTNPGLANTFTGVENLNGGTGDDNFAFVDMPGMPGSVDGNINGGAGFDCLDYSALTILVTTNLETGTSSRIGGTFANIDCFIGGGGGVGVCDVLIGQNVDSLWTLLDQNDGDVNGFQYFGYETLTGGTANDTFLFTENGLAIGSVDCDINGGGGTDKLDYSLVTVAVTTNLQTRTSTRIGGVFSGIECLTGSMQFDTLIGEDNNNLWTISARNAGDVDGFLFDMVDNLTGGNADDRFLFTNAPKIGGLDGNVDGGPGGTDTLDYSQVNREVVVDLATGRATRIEGTFSNIDALIGSTFVDKLIGANTVNTWTINNTNAGNINGTFAFTAFENLCGGTQADTFSFVDAAPNTGSVTGFIDGGFGTDTLNYAGIGTAATTNLETGVTSRVGNFFTDIEALVGSPAGHTLTGRNVPNLWTIDGANAGFVNGFRFTNVPSLVGGNVADRFVLALNGSVSGSIDAAAGSDTLVGYDVANAWSIARTNGGSLNFGLAAAFVTSFDGVENLVGGALADTFAFEAAAAAGVAGNVDGGLGEDTLNYAAVTTALDVNLETAKADRITGTFQSVEVLIGNNVTLSKLTGQNKPNVWTIDGGNDGNVDGFRFTNVPSLVGGNVADRFVLALNGSVSGSIDGAAGSDTLVGYDVANAWSIARTNGGSLNFGLAAAFVTSFDGVENLVGGALADTFAFTNTGLIGNLDGGDGSDRLDYSALTTASDTNLQLATSTGIAVGGTFRNMESVTGSTTAFGKLTGQNNANVWVIDALNAGNVDGFSFTQICNLTGGTAKDRFEFGPTGSLVKPAGTSGDLDGGADSDTLVGKDTSNRWTLTGVNAGTLTSPDPDPTVVPPVPTVFTQTWVNVENLVGGSLDDRFVFSTNTAMVAGKVDGGMAMGDNIHNTLDYSTAAVTLQVLTNLQTGMTSNTGGFLNMTRLIGGINTTDTLIGRNVNNLWSLTATNTGSVGGFLYSAIESITGGTARDVFQFVDGGFVGKVRTIGGQTGTINGGNGVNAPNDNWLDYHLVSRVRVVANVASGLATTVNGAGLGRILSIDNVIGSADGGDWMWGNGNSNVLVTFGRGNQIYGNGNKDVLIGGQMLLGQPAAPRNVIVGGADQDLIIPGSTVHDTNPDALGKIKAEWVRVQPTTANFNARVHNLFTGQGLTQGVQLKLNVTVFLNSVTPSTPPVPVSFVGFEQTIVFGGNLVNVLVPPPDTTVDFIFAGFAAVIRDIAPGEVWTRFSSLYV